MADEINDTIAVNLPDVKSEAKIILDWDDGQWYVSSIQNADGSITSSGSADETVDSTSGVKVAVWDKGYKYNEHDIVGYDGSLYASQQNLNQDNVPSDGTFWWYPVVDLTNVDAVTLEGRNLQEIIRAVLGGNVISDYYKKSETDNIILTYINNVNAKKLNDWTLENIKDDYNALVSNASSTAKDDAIEYFTDESLVSYQQSIIDEFNENISDDDINKF